MSSQFMLEVSRRSEVSHHLADNRQKMYSIYSTL